MVSDPNQKIELSQVEARQGSRKPNLIYVLGGGLVLVVIVFAIIWMTQSH